MKINPTSVLTAGFLSVFMLSMSSLAQTSTKPGKPADAVAGKPSNSAADMTEGEVRQIDKEAGKITLKHDQIKNLGMPGMTMSFQVRDKALLDKVQPGDKVKLAAVSEGGKLVVTEIRSKK